MAPNGEGNSRSAALISGFEVEGGGQLNPGCEEKLKCWHAEDPSFWKAYGEKIATRNLMCSVPNLAMMFAVWMIWSQLINEMKLAHDRDPHVYSFHDYVYYKDPLNPTEDEKKAYVSALAVLPTLAGFGGATMRVTNTFMVAACGTRMHNVMNSVLAMVVMLVLAFELSEEDPSYYTLCFCAASCGIGGGGFSSSSSSMSFFFPKHRLGFATATNGGIGNLGVSLSQFLLPIAATYHMFPGTHSVSHEFAFYPQNFALIYAVLLALFAALAYFGMNTLPQHGSPSGSDLENMASWARVTATGYAATYLSVVLFLWSIPYVGANKSLVIVRVLVLSLLVCTCAVVFLYVGGGAGVRSKLKSLMPTTKDANLWWMTYLYIMCFGSFIGFAASFPLLVTQVFGYLPDGSPNPAMAGVAAKYAWLGPFVGSFARVAGGNLSDTVGAARVTHFGTILQIVMTVVAAHLIDLARAADAPEEYFMPFLITFVMLYATTGSSNGSTFKQMGVLFTGEAKGPVLGWTAAIGAYCSALFPALFAAFDDKSMLLNIFAVYYVSCLGVNYWFYYRANAQFPC